MSITERAEVLEQYGRSTNLDARVALHDRFSVNPAGWHPWVFDRLDLRPGVRVLEVGCGPGHLWRKNLERLTFATRVFLTDLSEGMINEARRNLDARPEFGFAVADARHLPFDAASFDVVVANHMLYHVPDRGRALAELRRVLRPNGRFFASTVGRNHLRELGEIVAHFAPAWTSWSASEGNPDAFTLENGKAQIARHFATVSLVPYDDALVVTEAAPLVAYILSGSAGGSLDAAAVGALSEFVEAELATLGAIRITKASGLFVAADRS